MISLIIGNKGSGKTKRLVELVNAAVDASKGNVVCIEKGLKLTYDLTHRARLVNSEEYGIVGYEALYGFIAGILASNYDVTDLFVDNTMKICGGDVAALEQMLDEVAALLVKHDVNVFMTASLAEDAATDGIKKYV